MKNEAIAPGWMDKGSQVTFELAHPAAAMRHTVSNGYLVLSARRKTRREEESPEKPQQADLTNRERLAMGCP